MLGNLISDPHGIESVMVIVRDLITDICTILGPDKILQWTEAIHTISMW